MTHKREFSCQIVREVPIGFDRTKEGTIVVLASEPVEDRYGDIVVPPWRLDSYRQNPVVLVSHDYYELPIARAVQISVLGDRLLAEIEVDTADPRGAEVARKVADGFLSAVSVGFRCHRETPRSRLPEDDVYAGKGGFLLADNELLEISFCSVPALPSAGVQRSAPDLMRDLENLLRAHPEHRGRVEGILLSLPTPPEGRPAPEDDLDAFFSTHGA